MIQKEASYKRVSKLDTGGGVCVGGGEEGQPFTTTCICESFPGRAMTEQFDNAFTDIEEFLSRKEYYDSSADKDYEDYHQ